MTIELIKAEAMQPELILGEKKEIEMVNRQSLIINLMMKKVEETNNVRQNGYKGKNDNLNHQNT
jgi:hypothetical protein